MLRSSFLALMTAEILTTDYPMFTTEKLTDELINDEEVRKSAYKDHLGYLTIGVGRLIDARKGGGLTSDEIEYLLKNDIRRTALGLSEHLPWVNSLDDARHRALINMAFQMGVSGLLKFKNTLRLIKAGQYEKAADNALKSLWARQTPKRAKIVTEMIRTGEDRT